MNSEEKRQWLEARRHRISGTDWATILGLNPWKSAHQLWLEKTGLVSDEIEDNASMYWGRKLEPCIIQAYEEKNFCNVKQPGLLIHPEHDFICGTPDGLVYEEEFLSHGLEIKTATIKNSKYLSNWDAQPPIHYQWQCRAYMFLTDLPRWDLAVLINGSDYRQYTLYRDSALEVTAFNVIRIFYEDFILGGIEPTDFPKLVV